MALKTIKKLKYADVLARSVMQCLPTFPTPTEASHNSSDPPWFILILVLSFLWLVQNSIILYDLAKKSQRRTHNQLQKFGPAIAYWATARILRKLQVLVPSLP